ncbi:MAG: hypothetical protein IJ684_04125 [Bacteroidales bacterium]|nr:hypothetical protein [Bacteroidales bacterium]
MRFETRNSLEWYETFVTLVDGKEASRGHRWQKGRYEIRGNSGTLLIPVFDATQSTTFQIMNDSTIVLLLDKERVLMKRQTSVATD